jgi:hypothetical protein
LACEAMLPSCDRSEPVFVFMRDDAEELMMLNLASEKDL